MSFHLIAFQSSVLTSASVGVALGAVADGYAFGSSTDGFMLPKDMELIAAYACSEFLDQAWIVAPSLRRVGYPYITPVQQNPAGYSTPCFRLQLSSSGESPGACNDESPI